MHIVYLAEFENVMTSAYNASHKNLIEKGDLWWNYLSIRLIIPQTHLSNFIINL